MHFFFAFHLEKNRLEVPRDASPSGGLFEIEIGERSFGLYVSGRVFWGKKVLVLGSGDFPQIAGELLEKHRANSLSFLTEIQGPFILAIHERVSGRLYVIRDPAGERGCYYGRAGKRLLFADRMRPVEAGVRTIGNSLDICRESFARYLTYGFTPDEKTLQKGVLKIKPGHYTLADLSGSVTQNTYWKAHESFSGSLEQEPDERQTQELAGELRVKLEEAVARRYSLSKSPGVFLSGGLDSSLVAAILKKISPARLRTFSIHFGFRYPGEKYYSDLAARFLGSKHRNLKISYGMYKQGLEEVLGVIDEPIGDPILVPNYLLAKYAAGYTRDIFNGEGGDPLFGGPKNLPMLLGLAMGEDPIVNYLKSYKKLFTHLGRILNPDLFSSSTLLESLCEPIRPYLEDSSTKYFLNRLMSLNTSVKGGLNILLKVNTASGASGIRAHSPLFDKEIIKSAFALAPWLKLKGRTEKYILKLAVADLLPPEIVWREKSGMRVPIRRWLNRRKAPFIYEYLNSDKLVNHGLFDPAWLKEIRRDPVVWGWTATNSGILYYSRPGTGSGLNCMSSQKHGMIVFLRDRTEDMQGQYRQ